MRPSRLVRIAAASCLLAAIPVAQLSAVADPPTANATVATKSPTPSPSPSTALNTQHLDNLKTKGAAEIRRRETNLTAALTAIEANTKLASADKISLAGQVQGEISNLQSLATKLVADTTVTTAAADVQSIITEYRVYVLLLPKVRLVASADRFAVVEGKLSAIATTLQAKITSEKAAGKNVTAMQTQLTDLTTQTAAATTKSAGVVSPLLALQPADYNTDHAVLASYRATLGTALTEITAARNDAQLIVKALDALN
jgi:hypothetical protein